MKYVSLGLSAVLALSGCVRHDAPVPVPGAAATPAPSAAPARLVLNQSALAPTISFTAADINPQTGPCTDLNAHVNQKWLAANPVPADRTTWGSFESLIERSLSVQRQIAENLGASTSSTGVEKLIGDFWATGMNESAIEAAGIRPIQPLLDEVAALRTSDDLSRYLRNAQAKGRGVLFGFGAESDFKDSNRIIAYATQDGLGLPDKTYYSGDEYKAQRDAYEQHIAATLRLGGADAATAASQAKAVMAIETALAEVSYSSEDLSRDISKFYNPVSIVDADRIAPSIGWTELFAANGVARPDQFSLSNPGFFTKLDSMIRSTPIADWQSYLRFHTIDSAAPFLSKAFADQAFSFYSRTLRGQQEQKTRWKRVLDTINGSAGQAMGQIYVSVAFPPESKAQMQQLVSNLSTALKARLENLEWMGAETRAKALEKWAAFTPKIGYPDKWRDWSGLRTSRSSYVENVMAAAEFNHKYDMARIGKPKDKTEWGMNPQTVNASYNPLQNEITFPAAILQPPFFDPKADPALNYGGIGGVIGHEMLHGYDDQGSRFDAAGSFVNWWQASDEEGFKSRTAMLVEQFNGYEALPGKNVNGNLTLGENIADLGGLTVAYDALKLAQRAKSDPMLQGLTQDQRFFMNWATIWRRNYTPKELEVRLVTDPHAPARYRAIGAPSNMQSFADAFGCKSGDPMVRAQRIAIW